MQLVVVLIRLRAVKEEDQTRLYQKRCKKVGESRRTIQDMYAQLKFLTVKIKRL